MVTTAGEQVVMCQIQKLPHEFHMRLRASCELVESYANGCTGQQCSSCSRLAVWTADRNGTHQIGTHFSRRSQAHSSRSTDVDLLSRPSPRRWQGYARALLLVGVVAVVAAPAGHDRRWPLHSSASASHLCAGPGDSPCCGTALGRPLRSSPTPHLTHVHADGGQADETGSTACWRS